MIFRQVPISPDCRISWQTATLPELNATLYLPDTQPKSIQIATLLKNGSNGALIAEGHSGGKIYESPLSPDAVVIKEFTADYEEGISPNYGDFATLKLHVLLASGLTKVRQRGPWRIRGVRVLGALVAHTHENADIDPQNPDAPVTFARWAMERITPPTNSGSTYVDNIPDFPLEEDRAELYFRAFSAAAGNRNTAPPSLLDFDDDPSNLMIERFPKKKGAFRKPGVAVKIDLQAHSKHDLEDD